MIDHIFRVVYSEAIKKSQLKFVSPGLQISDKERQSRADAYRRVGIESISNFKEPKTVLNQRFGSLAFAPFVSKLFIDRRVKFVATNGLPRRLKMQKSVHLFNKEDGIRLRTLLKTLLPSLAQ